MDVVGAQADDDEQEFIKNICEKELLSGDSLLGLFAPLLIDICSSPIKYPDSKVGNIDFICCYEDPPKLLLCLCFIPLVTIVFYFIL